MKHYPLRLGMVELKKKISFSLCQQPFQKKKKKDQTFHINYTKCSYYRKYLFSRSLLTTPIDSSFSSQSDDFENLNDSEMSESLIYCLNGNDPIDDFVGLPSVNNDNPVTPRTTSRIFATSGNNSCHKNSIPIKRPLKSDDDLGTNSLTDPIYGEYSCINAKKNHLELDETAL